VQPSRPADLLSIRWQLSDAGSFMNSVNTHCMQEFGCCVGAGKSVIATDVLWSDPAPEPGLVENEARGVGLLFGPDVTQVATACICAARVLQYML